MKVKPIVLLGGYDKHLPFDTLGDELCQHSKAAVLCGATAQKIEDAIRVSSCYHDLPVYRTSSLADSVRLAHAIAKEGDTVLLSPACASFDAFRNFEERGDAFRDLVMSL